MPATHGVFQEIVVPLTAQLYRYAYRLTQNERDAEDLVQDGMLRGFSRFHQFQDGTSPLAWMYTIVRSIFINQYRKKKRSGHVIPLEDFDRGPEQIQAISARDIPQTPEDFFFHNLLDPELKTALDHLPRAFQEIIVLIDMEELSYKEASDVLGVPSGTVMSRLHRARRTLQDQLRDLAVRKGILKSSSVESIQTRKKISQGGAK
jgi:RNA polymerase sigma-70 factor (ECF subfamily)